MLVASASSSQTPASGNATAEAGTAEPDTSLIARRLIEEHDAFVFDMDGVLWRGGQVLDGAPQAIHFLATDAQKLLFFATNNSTSTPAELQEKLRRLGFGWFPLSRFYCTAWVAAEVLRAHGVQGKVLCLGTEALASNLGAVEGVEVVTLSGRPTLPAEMDAVTIDRSIQAVVIGFDPRFCYYRLAYATCLLQENDDILYIATNEDINFPTSRFKLPGSGSLIKALTTAVGRAPIVCGKPSTLIADHLVQKHNLQAERVCMVGDNLLTDIAFGQKAKFTTLLVETGMHNRLDVEQMCAARTASPHADVARRSSAAVTLNHSHSHPASAACRLHSGAAASFRAQAAVAHEAGDSCIIRKSLETPGAADIGCSAEAVEAIRERRRHEREDLRHRRRSEREESYERHLRLRAEEEERRRQVRQEIASKILQLKAEEEAVKERLRRERKDFKERQKHDREESQERRIRLEGELEQIEEKLLFEREREREEEHREREELRELRRKEKEEVKVLEHKYREESQTRKLRARQEREELEERLRREREKLRQKYEHMEKKAEERITAEKVELEKLQRHRRSESQERHAQARRDAQVVIKQLEEAIEKVEVRMREEEEVVREKLRSEKDQLQQRLERELQEFQRRHKEQYELLAERRRREREESQERRRHIREDSQERRSRLRREREEVREIHRAERGASHEHYKVAAAERRERLRLQRQEELEQRKQEREASLECLRRERQASLERARTACAEAEERRRRHAAECTLLAANDAAAASGHLSVGYQGGYVHGGSVSGSIGVGVGSQGRCEVNNHEVVEQVVEVPTKRRTGFLRGLITRDNAAATTTDNACSTQMDGAYVVRQRGDSSSAAVTDTRRPSYDAGVTSSAELVKQQSGSVEALRSAQSASLDTGCQVVHNDGALAKPDFVLPSLSAILAGRSDLQQAPGLDGASKDCAI